MSSTPAILIYGDPVLRRRADDVTAIDGNLVSLAEDMLTVMYGEPGIGLAATQVGVEKRLFVYDVGDGPKAVVNPTITERDGLWLYAEGCLSLPGLFWDVIRPKEVLLTGWDLNEQPIEVEADELLARLFQHELDHLDGVLLIDHLEAEQRERALGLFEAISTGAGTLMAAGEHSEHSEHRKHSERSERSKDSEHSKHREHSDG